MMKNFLKISLCLLLLLITAVSFVSCGCPHEAVTWAVQEEATVTSDGYREGTCKDCGESIRETLPAILGLAETQQQLKGEWREKGAKSHSYFYIAFDNGTFHAAISLDVGNGERSEIVPYDGTYQFKGDYLVATNDNGTPFGAYLLDVGTNGLFLVSVSNGSVMEKVK